MSNATIKLEFLAGTSFIQAVEEAKQKCKLFDVAFVHFDFNGVSCSVKADADIKEMEKKFFAALDKNVEHKYIVG